MTTDPLRALSIANWLIAEQEKQRFASIEDKSLPRLYIFGQEPVDYFYGAHQAAIFERAVSSWPALTLWTPEGLVERVGADTAIQAQSRAHDDPDYELNKARHTTTFSFGEFMALRNTERGPYLTAYNAPANVHAMRPLWADVLPLPFLTSTSAFPWIGGPNTFTPLHFDLTNNLIIQVVGEKKFWVGPPSLTPHMRNEVGVFSAWHDIDNQPDNTLGERLTLSPGDALFLPFGWWHQARSLSFSVTLTHTNFIWPNDASGSFPS